MTAGRPTEYKEEILVKAQDYYDNLPEDEVIHSIEGLAEHINIARSTIYEWIKDEDKKDFSDIVSQILERQGKFLINNGLSGKYNSKITMALLSKHGYREERGFVGAEGKDLFPSKEDLDEGNKAIEQA